MKTQIKSFTEVYYCQILIIVLMFPLQGCSSNEENIDIGIAINPWPSYDMLWLAQEKGFFSDEGIDVNVMEFNTLLDANSAFLNGRADIVCGSLFEVLLNRDQLTEDTEIILFTDYSNGADVVMVHQSIDDIAGLKDKTIGVELGSLGEHVLFRALATQGLTMNDVNIQPIHQTDMMASVNRDKLQAVVSYPPFIIPLLADPNWKSLFSSKQIPYEFVSLLSIRSAFMKEHPTFRSKLFKVWGRTLTYVRENQETSYQLMAARQGVSVEEFADTAASIKLMNLNEQSIIFDLDGPVQDTVRVMHKSLRDKQAISMDVPANHFMPARH